MPRIIFIAWLSICYVGCNRVGVTDMRGQLHVDSTIDGALYVQLSGHWPAPGSRTVPLTGDASMEIGDPALVATAFVDTDADGTLTQYAEPSAPCMRVGNGWSCKLERIRIVAHRITSFRVGAPPTLLADNLKVRVESFAADGSRDGSTRACLEEHPDVCASIGGDALGPSTSQASAISPCAFERAVHDEAPFDLVVTTAGAQQTTTVAHPPRLDATAEITSTSEVIVAHVETSLPISNAIGWYGTVDATEVYWSTEQHQGTIDVEGNHVSIRFPRQATTACDGCKLMIQLARTSGSSTLGAISEARFVVEAL